MEDAKKRNNIYYIKMGDKNIADYLFKCCVDPGPEKILLIDERKELGLPATGSLWLGFHDVRQESIDSSIAEEQKMIQKGESLLDDNNWKKCWKEAFKDLKRKKKIPLDKDDASVTRTVSMIRAFCMAKPDDIFFTFYGGKMYWAAIEAENNLEWVSSLEVRYGKDNPRANVNAPSGSQRGTDMVRAVRWSDRTKNGSRILYENRLSGRITKKQMFQSTLCRLNDRDDEKNKPDEDSDDSSVYDAAIFRYTVFQNETDSVLKDYEKAHKDMTDSIKKMIRRLNPSDFEILGDLIFTKSGWIKTNAVGGNAKDIDLEYVKPVTGERVFVQVKSVLNKSTFDKGVSGLFSYSAVDEKESASQYNYVCYFLYHTSDKSDPPDDSHLLEKYLENTSCSIAKDWYEKHFVFMGPDELAKLAMDSEIMAWLKKTVFGALD